MGIIYNTRIIREGLVLHLDAANRKSYPGTGTTWTDLSGNNYNFTVYGSPVFNSAGYFTFSNDQTTQYIMLNSFPAPANAITFSCWFRSNFTTATQTPFTYSVGGNNEMLFFLNSNTQLAPLPLGVSIGVNTSNMTNIWVNFAWTRVTSTGKNIFYRDGNYVGEYTASAGTAVTPNGYLIIGQEADSPGGTFDSTQNLDGDFSNLQVYNRALTETEVRQNFEAYRDRYGI